MRILYLLCATILLSGCGASSYISYQNISTPQEPYNNIFIASVFEDINFKQLTETTYDSCLKENINELGGVYVREAMEKTAQKIFRNPRLKLTLSHETFKVNEEIGYHDFLDAIEQSKANAILLINQNQFYREYKPHTITINNSEEIYPTHNALFFIYLIDAQTRQTVWASRIDASGSSFNTKESFYKSICKKINKALLKEKFLVPPLKQ
jgi:hypothetical protein